LDQIKYAFDDTYRDQAYDEDNLRDLSNQLVILEKGIVFEWYSRQGEFSFDVMSVAERCFNKALDAFQF